MSVANYLDIQGVIPFPVEIQGLLPTRGPDGNMGAYGYKRKYLMDIFNSFAYLETTPALDMHAL